MKYINRKTVIQITNMSNDYNLNIIQLNFHLYLIIYNDLYQRFCEAKI